MEKRNQKHLEKIQKLDIQPKELRGMKLLYYWKEAIVWPTDLSKEQLNSIVRWMATHTTADIKKEL